VVPVTAAGGEVVAVLDVDSDWPDAFGAADRGALEALCADLGRRFGGSAAR
jgi:putative methionine-R-sulfoxide reductase with GAF domain